MFSAKEAFYKCYQPIANASLDFLDVRIRPEPQSDDIGYHAFKVELLVREKGHFSFRRSIEDRKECCGIRKVEPLRRALAGRAAWVTGLRREQSVTRTAVEVLELDAAHGGIAKLNPLAAWTEAQVWSYAREHGLPVNALHARGYPSIGCAPCTRAIAPGEDARAGRWWWESAEHKECGLHPGGGR